MIDDDPDYWPESMTECEECDGTGMSWDGLGECDECYGEGWVEN